MRETPLDLGFRVYKQAPSSFKPWRDYRGDSLAAAQAQLASFADPLAQGWQPAQLRVEVMLQQGFPLDSRVARNAALAHNAVEVVSHEQCEHRLWLCLDDQIAPETVAALGLAETGFGAQDVFVCRDAALDDQSRARLEDRVRVIII